MRKIENEIAVIKEQIERRILHPYLIQNIESPVIDEEKLFIIVVLLEQTGITINQIRNYSLTTMLIQMALDTHEHVDNLKVDDLGQKKRQLTVLAGDYYSGLYYKLLSEIEDISMIRTLAEGIKDMNEYKIILYQLTPDTIDELMNTIKMVEMSLIERLIDYFQLSNCKEIISEFLLIKRLQKEIQLFLNGKVSVVYNALIKIVYPGIDINGKVLTFNERKYLLSICEHYIKITKDSLLVTIDKNPYINHSLKQLIEQFLIKSAQY